MRTQWAGGWFFRKENPRLAFGSPPPCQGVTGRTMSILIDKNTRVVTQGITGKSGMFHTQTSRAYANGKDCFVAGVNPKKAGENFEGLPIFGTVKDAKEKAGVNTSVIYVPPPF